MAEYIEYFSIEDLTSVLMDHLDKDSELYEYETEEEERLETCDFLYEAFSFAFHSTLPLFMGEGNKDNTIATVYAFNRTRAVLIKEESLLFFHDLLHKHFFADEIKDADGNYVDEIEDADGNHMISLGDFIKDEEKLGRIFSVCAIAYAWNMEYWEMRSKGIDSEEKANRRIKTLEKDYLLYEDKDRLLKYYKIGNPVDNKSYKEIIFTPALTELLASNPHKKEIMQKLTKKIYPPYTPQ